MENGVWSQKKEETKKDWKYFKGTKYNNSSSDHKIFSLAVNIHVQHFEQK